MRHIAKTVTGMPATDGAGVKLKRVIGTPALDSIDPFLMLDEFGSDDPDAWIAGFPDHPHRGFETVTIMLEGRVKHADSVGNKGVLESGDVQWMTAGRGIIHSEMPERADGRLRGFQLWVNLPGRLKMSAPRYQDVSAARIASTASGGATIRVIAGDAFGVAGAASTLIPVRLLDVAISPDATFEIDVPDSHACFVYVYEGAVHGPDRAGKDSPTDQRRACRARRRRCRDPGCGWHRRKASVCRRRADPGASRALRSLCDEHARRAGEGLRRLLAR